MYRTYSNLKRAIAVSAVLGVCGISNSLAVDQDVTPDVIFGSGNLNGGFTVDEQDGVELGLRGKLRHNAAGNPENTFNSNNDVTYSFNKGVAPTQSSPTAEWSFEWSINSNVDGTGANLNQYTYSLQLDSDPSQGTNFGSFDPINGANPGLTGNRVQWDHAIGNNSTGNGGGTSIPNSTGSPKVENFDSAGYSTLIDDNNVAQNSWKPHWFIPGFDPDVDGTYDIVLTASDGGGVVASTSIQIIVGVGGAALPEGGATVLMLGTALLTMSGIRRFRKQSRD